MVKPKYIEEIKTKKKKKKKESNKYCDPFTALIWSPESKEVWISWSPLTG